MQKIAVVILNWNGRKFLEQFLPNVIQNSVNEYTTVYIIDNASTDSSIVFLQQKYPNIPCIILDKNYGFADGYNRGLQQIEADYFVLLNSDVEVTPNWIEPIITFMKADSNCAVCMPKLKSYQAKEYFEYAGAAGGFIDKYGYPFCDGRLFDSIEKDNGQYNEIKEIFWGSGAALFVKSKIFQELGGLDANFFAHMEEIDFCWRVKNAGYSIYYIPSSIVYHVGGGTLPQSNPFKTYLNFRNNLFLLYKNLPKNKLHSTIFIRKLFDGVAFIKFLVSFDFANCKAIWNAHMDYYKALPMLKEKRKELEKVLVQSKHSQIYTKSIVVQYFIKRKKAIAL